MKNTGIPLAHVKAAPPIGWMPMWSAKKERQLARRKEALEAAEAERRQRVGPQPIEHTAPHPKPFWQRVGDRVRRFLSRRMA